MIKVILISCALFIGCGCASADKNITSKSIDCSNTKDDAGTALICCLQFMSSASGNDSKDLFCSKLLEQLSENFRAGRKKRTYEFCEKTNKPDKCWDRMQAQ